MTVDQATRRCTGCGRYLAPEAFETGACTACGTKVRMTPATTVVAPGAVVPEDAVAVPIEKPNAKKPLGVAPTRATASLSKQAIRPPKGVVILRPSELHPDAPPPAVRRAPERFPEPEPEPDAASEPRLVLPATPVEPLASVAPDPAPAQPPVLQAAPASAPTVSARTDEDESFGEGTTLMWWVVRIVVGVLMGLLIGIAIPFLLSL